MRCWSNKPPRLFHLRALASPAVSQAPASCPSERKCTYAMVVEENYLGLARFGRDS